MTKTILVIEDDVLLRNVFVKVLVRENYDVLEADSAIEALQVSRGHDGTINLLIVGSFPQTMPAPEIMERLRESRPEMKVLQIGDPWNPPGRKGDPMRGATLLQKPFLPESLAEELKTILGPSPDASSLTFTGSPG
jgi:two-component system, cell cycle sensor histidine kinase and response regulator CckA